MIEQVIEILTILVALSPILVQIFGYIAQLSNHQKLENLHDRADIIVEALVESGFANEQKKRIAMHKLSKYADEVGIQVTTDQVEDYIESAYVLFKTFNK